MPDAFRVANQRDDDGFFSRTALTRGNPIDRQYDINFNVGGPLWKQKAWFFASYRLNDQYKYTLGSDILARSKLTNHYTCKGTFQLNQNNQVIGFLNKRNKLQELRDLAPPLVPITAARYQASRNYPWKMEWTSVLGSRAFLDVHRRQLVQLLPAATDRSARLRHRRRARPSRHRHQPAHRRTTTPTRTRSATSRRSTSSLSYFKDGWAGSHDFKFGYDWKRDKIQFGREQPGGNSSIATSTAT